ncbi:DUF1722 domain-containing protein [Candidatus Poribacteria bacterium]|nr:DUF1722 domain-containing protein [Candidatus Poribacteria bacterium]
MRQFVKPVVVVSKCLGFANCRYNGAIINDDLVTKLRDYVDFIPVCPEMEVGLGVPREPIRMVQSGEELKLMQPATGLDITRKMEDFASSFLDSVGYADGFILKSRSPSCGSKDVKVYPDIEKSMPATRSAGFFGMAVLKKYPNLSVENEGRLKNFQIREHFLTKLFTLSDFRKVKDSGTVAELVRFHSENKHLLLAYNQEKMREMGRIVADASKKDISEVIEKYENRLHESLYSFSKPTANINVLMHGLGYFSDKLNSEEKQFFLDTLERYREDRIPLSVPLNILRSFIIRFEESYLKQQTFFDPYPEELVEISDSGKGRNL